MRAAAFLRAVNVGGNNLVPMAELKRRMEDAGFRNARTYLASGNVTFDARGSLDAAARRMEKLIEAWLGLEVAVMARSLERLHALLRADPFARHRAIPGVKLYVGFASAEAASRPRLPLAYGKEGLEVVGLDAREVFVILRPGAGPSALPNMSLEKALGAAVTLRNWNTVERVAKAEETAAEHT